MTNRPATGPEDDWNEQEGNRPTDHQPDQCAGNQLLHGVLPVDGPWNLNSRWAPARRHTVTTSGRGGGATRMVVIIGCPTRSPRRALQPCLGSWRPPYGRRKKRRASRCRERAGRVTPRAPSGGSELCESPTPFAAGRGRPALPTSRRDERNPTTGSAVPPGLAWWCRVTQR